jgi:hypothetical protein
VTKDEALKIEDSDFNNYTKQKLFEYIVELREALSTHPHQWQGLTDDEVHQLHKEHFLYKPTIRKIEVMLKEKNT